MDDQEPDDIPGELTPAFTRALAEMHGSFLQFLRRRLGSQTEAEEVMQQFYLRVVEHASQLRDEESMLGWLRRVLQSALSDHRRRSSARTRAEADFARKDAAVPPETEEMADFICRCLFNLLPHLKPEYAEALQRLDLDNEPREQVARTLGVNMENLTVRLHRARQALRRILELSCETCPVHGFLDCGCDYTRRLRSAAPQTIQHSGPNEV